MAEARLPEDIVIFCSIIYRDDEVLTKTLNMLYHKYGRLMYLSRPLNFDQTSYYNQELGSPLKRVIIAFDNLMPRNCLPEVKTWTNELEQKLSLDGQRRMNIDPGILCMESVNLATAKPYSHRFYLDKGIWGEVTLMYQGQSYFTLEWTYPDYKTPQVIEILNDIRKIYRRRRRCPEA